MYQFEMQCSNLFFGGRFIAQGVVIWAAATNLLKFIARLGTYASFGIPETHTYGNLSSKNTPFIKLQEAMENFVFPNENKTKLMKMYELMSIF